MDRRRRTGEIVDLIDLDIERKRHVVAQKREARLAHHVSDVASRPGEEIVDAEDIMSLRYQPLAKMRTEKSRPTGHQHLFNLAVAQLRATRFLPAGDLAFTWQP